LNALPRIKRPVPTARSPPYLSVTLVPLFPPFNLFCYLLLVTFSFFQRTGHPPPPYMWIFNSLFSTFLPCLFPGRCRTLFSNSFLRRNGPFPYAGVLSLQYCRIHKLLSLRSNMASLAPQCDAVPSMFSFMSSSGPFLYCLNAFFFPGSS